MTKLSSNQFELLNSCHEFMAENYNNSMRLPSNLLQLPPCDGVQVKELWRDYIKYKFIYLNYLYEASSPADAEEQIINTLQTDGYRSLQFFVSTWRGRAKKEAEVYMLRAWQLPADNVKDEYYYCGCDACMEWCDKLDSKLSDEKTVLAAASWDKRQNKLNQICEQIGPKPNTSREHEVYIASALESVTSGLHKRIYAVRQHMENAPTQPSSTPENGFSLEQTQEGVTKCLGCFTDWGKGDMIVSGAILDESFLSTLQVELIKHLYLTGYDETEIITEFLRKIREKFPCELCDYLDVEMDESRLSWRTATSGLSNMSSFYRKKTEREGALEATLEKEESYAKGQGISGSIFFQSTNIEEFAWRHVGSNDVENDPRADEPKANKYQKNLYTHGVLKTKRVENFWIFPVVRQGKLYGAFRVVNKLDSDGKLQACGWPYIARVQLSLIAGWFANFLEAVSPQISRASKYVVIAQREDNIQRMLEDANIDWVKPETVETFLTYLASSVDRRIEKRSPGCCIVLVNRLKGNGTSKFSDKYPLIELTQGNIPAPYDRLDTYVDAVDPLQGAFFFDEKGDFLKVGRLQPPSTINGNGRGGIAKNSMSEGVDYLQELTRVMPSLGFLLERNSRYVQIISGGFFLFDIHFEASVGAWRFRNRKKFRELMDSLAPALDSSLKDRLAQTCFLLSNRHWGAMFVVGDYPEGVFKFSNPTITFNFAGSDADIDTIAPSLLAEFAKLDGSTFISKDGRITKTNTEVTVLDANIILKLFPGRGTRHSAAEKIARKAPEALVIVVSESGGVSLLANGAKDVSRDQ